MNPKERLRQFQTDLNTHVQDGMVTARLSARRTGEWLRRRTMDGLNGTLGLGIIGIGYIFLNTVINNPSLNSLPADIAPTLSQFGQLHLTNLNAALQSIGDIFQSSWEITRTHLTDAGTHDLAAASFSLAGDGMLAEFRHTINTGERERRYSNGRLVRIQELFPDPRRVPSASPASV